MKNSKLSLIISILSILLLSVPPASAKVYKWKDDDGQLHFSDIPPQDTSKAELLDLSNKSKTKQKSNSILKSNNKYESDIKKKLQDYKSIKEHHQGEDITPYLQKLKNKSDETAPNKPENINPKKNNQAKIIKKNCETAKNNLESLEISKIIMSKNNKLTKLSEKQHKAKMAEAISQVEDYCKDQLS